MPDSQAVRGCNAISLRQVTEIVPGNTGDIEQRITAFDRISISTGITTFRNIPILTIVNYTPILGLYRFADRVLHRSRLRNGSRNDRLRDALAFEQQALAECVDLQHLLERENVEAARRAMLLYPHELCWDWWDDVTVELRFWLPAGSFATSVVRELMNTSGDYANIAE